MPTNRSAPPPDIDELRERHKKLDGERIAAEANLKTATERLDALKKEAVAAFKTDDLEKLKQMLKDMHEANELARRKYQEHLEKIEADLKEVEQRHAAARNPS